MRHGRFLHGAFCEVDLQTPQVYEVALGETVRLHASFYFSAQAARSRRVLGLQRPVVKIQQWPWTDFGLANIL